MDYGSRWNIVNNTLRWEHLVMKKSCCSANNDTSLEQIRICFRRTVAELP